jgi:hypothetical protein
MSKKIFLDTFYKQFSDFLTELDKMYPNDSDFSAFSTKLTVLKTVNPMLPIQFIKTEIIEKYQEQIFKKDESFFVNSKDIEQSSEINIFFKLKSYITDMTEENKEIVWSYIHIIVKLTMKILEF